MRDVSSAGGAQPKALISFSPSENKFKPTVSFEKDYKPILLKFQRGQDDEEPKIEHALAIMARRCGIKMAESLLVRDAGYTHFGSVRFDVKPTLERLHFHSYAGITHREFLSVYKQHTKSLDDYLLRFHDPEYGHLVKLAGDLTFSYETKIEVLKRCAYNVRVNNIDDHARNHGFIFDGKEWSLSKAYDVTHSPDVESVRAMTVNGKSIYIEEEDIRSIGRANGIFEKELDEIFNQLHEGLKTWRECAEEADLSEQRADEIEAFFFRSEMHKKGK